jgi:hypothetical protein
MLDRRGALKAALLAALGLALPPARASGLEGLRVVRRGKVFIVDGWVLTAADLRALRDHVL